MLGVIDGVLRIHALSDGESGLVEQQRRAAGKRLLEQSHHLLEFTKQQLDRSRSK